MSAETTQSDVLNMPWASALDGDEGLLYGIPGAEDSIIQPGLPFLEAILVKTEMPVPLFSSPNTTTDGSISLRQEASMGEQYPLFVPLQNQYGKGFTETPISDPRALKAVGMDSSQPDGVRHWAMRSFWEAYHEEIAHLDEEHQTGKVRLGDYSDRIFEINRKFGLDSPSNDIDGTVDIGTGMITDLRARVALANQEDTDRRAQLDEWRARYRAGAFGNTTFSAVDAGINEDELTSPERQKRREAEAAIRGDAYIHRISPNGEPPMYAYKASIDRQHEAAVVELQRAPEKRELAGMSQSARWARAGMPYLAVAERIAEFGDDVAKHVPPWVRPVVRGTARATAVFAGLAVAACSGGMQATFTPEATHIPTPTSLEPTHISPPLIDAPAAPESYVGYNPVDLVEAPGVLPGAGGQEGSQVPVKMTDSLHTNLIAQGWAPVYDPATKNYALIGGTAADRSVACFSTTRDQVFGPRPALDIHPLRGVEGGVAIFTDPSGTVAEQTVMNVSLVGAPEGATCIQAINNDPQSPEYTLLKLLLIGPNGDVLGAIPTFSGDDLVVVQWSETEGPQLFVNGNKTWFVSTSGETVATVMPKWTETPMVLPTLTPEPTAPPVEAVPTSCLDEQQSQNTFDVYLKDNNFTREAFITQAQESFKTEKRVYAEDPTNTYSIGAVLPGIILGEYNMTINLPKLSGKGYCVVIAYPSSEGISVNSFLVDATIDGQYSNALLKENTGNPQDNLKTTSEATRQWIAKRIGKVIVFGVPVAHKTEIIQNAAVFSPIWKRLLTGSYVELFGNDPQLIKGVTTDPLKPDPAQIVKRLDPQKEIGLFAFPFADPTP